MKALELDSINLRVHNTLAAIKVWTSGTGKAGKIVQQKLLN